MRGCGGKALVSLGYTFGTAFSPPGPLHFVRCGVSCCSAVRDLRRLPPPSLGVSSLDLGRLLASGPFFFARARDLPSRERPALELLGGRPIRPEFLGGNFGQTVGQQRDVGRHPGKRGAAL